MGSCTSSVAAGVAFHRKVNAADEHKEQLPSDTNPLTAIVTSRHSSANECNAAVGSPSEEESQSSPLRTHSLQPAQPPPSPRLLKPMSLVPGASAARYPPRSVAVACRDADVDGGGRRQPTSPVATVSCGDISCEPSTSESLRSGSASHHGSSPFPLHYHHQHCPKSTTHPNPTDTATRTNPFTDEDYAAAGVFLVNSAADGSDSMMCDSLLSHTSIFTFGASSHPPLVHRRADGRGGVAGGTRCGKVSFQAVVVVAEALRSTTKTTTAAPPLLVSLQPTHCDIWEDDDDDDTSNLALPEKSVAFLSAATAYPMAMANAAGGTADSESGAIVMKVKALVGADIPHHAQLARPIPRKAPMQSSQAISTAGEADGEQDL